MSVLMGLLAASALAQDAEDILAMEDKAGVELSGFADVGFLRPFYAPGSGWDVALARTESFLVGNLNVYLRARLDDRWHSMIETRYTHLPNGVGTLDASSLTLVRQDTRVEDYTDAGRRTLTLGGIEVERAWLEYSGSDAFNLRMGQFLTPYGIWNVDHGSPAIVAILRPYVVGEALIPERQTGFQLHGKAYPGNATAGYHLTVSNGRGPSSATVDLDHNKAVGGRLWVEDGRGIARAGVSGYGGRYTNTAPRLEAVTADSLDIAVDIAEQYDELGVGTDVRVASKGWLLQGELIANQRAYTDAGRPPIDSFDPTATGLAADRVAWGMYTLFGHRLPFGLMPYLLVEYRVDGRAGISNSSITRPGLNYTPIPQVALKLEAAYVRFYADGPFTEDIVFLQSQAAWAF